MRPGRGRAVFAALALGSAASCQLLAGTGDLKAHGASHPAGGGGATASGDVGGSSLGGHGGGEGGSGGNGGNGGACDPLKGAPSCGFALSFEKSGSEIQPTALAVAADGTSYLGGTATGSTAFGTCSDGSQCGFLQVIDAAGKKGAKVVFGTNGIGLSDVAELGDTGAHEVAFAGTLTPQATLSLSGGVNLTGKNQPIYVATFQAGLAAPLWAKALAFTAADTTDSNAKVRIGATDTGDIIAAANVSTSEIYAWGDCTSDTATAGEDIVITTFNAAGSCMPLLAFGGLSDQTVDVLRVAPGGAFLLAGGFEDQIILPKNSLSAGVAQVGAYATYFAKGQAEDTWALGLTSDHDVKIHGGGFAKSGGRVAVAGSFVGSVPVPTMSGARIHKCDDSDELKRRGFVQSLHKLESEIPAVDLWLCFGESGDTRIDDATIDDDGAVVVFGQTTGVVKFGKFEVGAAGGMTAAFALKIDDQGKIVWGTGPNAAPRATAVRAAATDGGYLLSGLFSGKIDLGCGCEATAVTQHDAFLARLGP